MKFILLAALAAASLLTNTAFATSGACGAIDDCKPVSDSGDLGHLKNYDVPQWQDHFATLRKGAILIDTEITRLFYWGEDGTFKTYPVSIARTEWQLKKGRTTIVRKVHGPSWSPTPRMRKEDPTLPVTVGPFDPQNPLGTHALYLPWKYIRIHGTHDNSKIGRKSSSGCFGLYNHNIAELYGLTQVGTQVVVI